MAEQIYKSHQQLAFTYAVLATFNNHVGKFQEADKLFKHSLDILSSIIANKHCIINTIKVNTGLNAYMLGEIISAKTYLEEILSCSNDLWKIWVSSFYLARICEQLGQYDNALKYMRLSFENASSYYKKSLHDSVRFQLTQAEVWPKLTKHTNLAYWQKALEVTNKMFGSKHYQAARYHHMLGQALESENRLKVAHNHYKQALEILNAQEIKHPNLKQFYIKNTKAIQIGIQRTLHCN